MTEEYKLSECERITRTETFGDKEMEVIYRKALSPVTPEYLASLPLEERKGLGAAPALKFRTYSPAPGIICEQDVPTQLRDGTIIYSDIYRPDTTEKVPAILAWSFFGKRPFEGGANYQLIGVPPQTVSDMAKFEAPDPGYWCYQGYAVANVDIRGCGRSGGDLKFWGQQYAEDGYDYIEWIAQQDWCNGKVGMFGNSGLAMSQWRIAATQPPHLACIAPWEATGDFYREALMEGGIPAVGFNDDMLTKLTGPGYLDDYAAMMLKYPFMNEYWEDKIPKWDQITIPTYVAAGWSHFHLHGSIEGFRRIKSRKKWLRCHRDFEWPDMYKPENLDDAKRFFDRYLKGIHNGWEMTPKVRMDVMDAYDFDYAHNRPETSFPLKRTVYKRLYLDASDCSMSFEPTDKEASVSYDAENGLVNFDMKFTEDTEITGLMTLHLWVEAKGNDDMDLFVTVKKLDADGNFLPHYVLGEPHPGAWGKLRVSRRALDPKLSKKHQPILAHTKDEKLSPGEIVPVDIEIWPTSKFFHAGEQIRVEIAPKYLRDEGWFEFFAWDINNKGEHVIHTGGQYDSWFEIPTIPPKYVAGTTVYR
jgi:predicted acyl esterase